VSYSIRIVNNAKPGDLERFCLGMGFIYQDKIKDFHKYQKGEVEVMIKLNEKNVEIFLVIPWRSKALKELYSSASGFFKKFGGRISGDGIEKRLPSEEEWLKGLDA